LSRWIPTETPFSSIDAGHFAVQPRDGDAVPDTECAKQEQKNTGQQVGEDVAESESKREAGEAKAGDERRDVHAHRAQVE